VQEDAHCHDADRSHRIIGKEEGKSCFKFSFVVLSALKVSEDIKTSGRTFLRSYTVESHSMSSDKPRIADDDIRSIPAASEISATTVVDAEDGAAYVAPFVPTCEVAQAKALEMMKLTGSDIIFDLGCGDARLLCESVKQIPGLRAVGLELRSMYVERAQNAAMSAFGNNAEARSRIDIRLEDMTSPSPDERIPSSLQRADLGSKCWDLTLKEDATVVYLFLVPKALAQIQSILNETVHHRIHVQKRSIRIIAYMFRIREWEHTSVEVVTKAKCPLYLYQFEPPTDES
jgi:hypothetical protein